MNLGEMMNQIRTILPNATVGEDSDGQLIIYTEKILGKFDEVCDLPSNER